MPHRLAALLTGLLLLAMSWQPARAEPIKVLTAGAMHGLLVEVLPGFEKGTGHKVTLDKDTAGGLVRRIAGGESFDLAIMPPAGIDALVAKGRIAAGSRVDIARVGVGVAVKAGAPLPDIGTVPAFRRTLLAARSVAYIDPKAGGSSGIYIDSLLDRLGIAAEVRPKARLKQGGFTAELVASGDAEIALQQISEILPVAGVVLVGPLPAEIQSYTTYAAALPSGGRDATATAAKALVDFLKASPSVAAAGRKKGLEPAD